MNPESTNSAPASQVPPASSAPSAHKNNTFMAVLAYLGILIIIPFIMAKEEPFVKFHLKQGAVLFIIEVALWLLGSMLWGFWQIMQIAHLLVVVLAIFGIINAVQGKEKELPVIGHWGEKIKI